MFNKPAICGWLLKPNLLLQQSSWGQLVLTVVHSARGRVGTCQLSHAQRHTQHAEADNDPAPDTNSWAAIRQPGAKRRCGVTTEARVCLACSMTKVSSISTMAPAAAQHQHQQGVCKARLSLSRCWTLPEILVSTDMALIVIVIAVNVPQERYSTCLYPSWRSTASSWHTSSSTVWSVVSTI